MSNSLSRPSWDRFTGPSWLSGAPWTSWDMWPQWLSPSLLVSPSRVVKAGRRTDVRLWSHCCSHRRGRPRRVWLIDLFCSLSDNIRKQSGFVFFFLLGFLVRFVLDATEKLLYFPAVLCWVISFFFLIPHCDVMHSLSALITSFKTMKWLCF